jgi:hypothetical protein
VQHAPQPPGTLLLSKTLLEPLSIAATAALAASWLVVNSLLAGFSGALGQALLLFRFLGKLLNVWSSASAIGLQALLERLQAVSMGVWLAPQQLQRYRAVAHSVDWASLGWAGELACQEQCGLLRCMQALPVVRSEPAS